MYFIPWDFNFSFLPNPNHPIDLIAEESIAEQFLQTPVFEERYHEIFCEILDYNFTENRLYEILDRRKSLIDNAVQTDPYIEFTFEEYEAENVLIKEWISTRIGQVQANLNSINTTCEPLLSPIDFQDITINEVVASSDSIGGVADPDGGYPDWIELYNNTDEAISLAGFYLSDDRDFMKHWAFPADAVIAANDYLIVWADRDLNETGLHADFKLSRQGGELFLIYENFTMIDEMTYEEQETNVAYARIPNGTGSFVQQAATPSANNEIDTSIEILDSATQWSVFPNPSGDKVNIKLPSSYVNEDYTISILDVYGRSQSIENTSSFSMANYPAGVYWIRLSLNGKTMTKKMIVE